MRLSDIIYTLEYMSEDMTPFLEYSDSGDMVLGDDAKQAVLKTIEILERLDN